MWINKLLDLVTLGVSFYLRKEAQKRKNRQELEIIKFKQQGKNNEKS